MLILNKWLLYIFIGLLPAFSFSQDRVIEKWKQEKENYTYRRSDNYKGPDEWGSSSPKRMERSSSYSSRRNGSGTTPGRRNGRGGGLSKDPRVKRPESRKIEQPDAPDVDLPSLKSPNIGVGFWKFLLILIIGAAVIAIIYLIIKNYTPKEKKVIAEVSQEEWNPEVISKSELELRLEAAMSEEDYRECVRIYFTFILKELIQKSWIYWSKEKTNYDYVLEMRSQQTARQFEECVRIYDIVWYGEYKISLDEYKSIQPVLEKYFKELER